MKTSAGGFLKKNMMIIALVIVVVLFAITTKGSILIPQNLNNLISQNAYVFVLATGMLLCILTGGNIDLAVGSVLCFAGAIGAVLMDLNVPIWIAVLVMLVIGTLVGAFQGFFIAWIKVPPFIATLAGMYAFRGFSNVVLQGQQIGDFDPTFLKIFGGGASCYVPNFLGGGSINLTCMLAGIIAVVVLIIMTVRGWAVKKKMGIPVDNIAAQIAKLVILSALIIWITWKLANYKGIPTVLIWIGLVLIVYGYITNHTAMGRYFYAVGGNEKATRLSGVNTKKVYFLAYLNMGLLAGLAAILAIARKTYAEPTMGSGYEMDAIAACFIGGASAYGGTGKISGVIIGATLMGVINQGMSLMSLPTNYQKAAKGIVLLLAVILDVVSRRKENK